MTKRVLTVLALVAATVVWAQPAPPKDPAAVGPGPVWQSADLAAAREQLRAEVAELARLEQVNPVDEQAVAAQLAKVNQIHADIWQRTQVERGNRPGRGMGMGPGRGMGMGPGRGMGLGMGMGMGCPMGLGQGMGMGPGGGTGPFWQSDGLAAEREAYRAELLELARLQRANPRDDAAVAAQQEKVNRLHDELYAKTQAERTAYLSTGGQCLGGANCPLYGQGYGPGQGQGQGRRAGRGGGWQRGAGRARAAAPVQVD